MLVALVSLLFVPVRHIALLTAFVILVLGVGYAFCGPMFVKGMAAHKARKEGRKNGDANDS